MNLEIQVQLDYTFVQPCDVLLQIEVAQLAEQSVLEAHIAAPAAGYLARVPAQDGIGERIWLRAEGKLLVDYRARVALTRQSADLAGLAIIPPHRLPGEAVPYLMPSRYCQSNQLATFAEEEFGTLEDGAKIAAMRDWVAAHLSYVPGSSDANTTAVDTFVARQGICRDYAHLVITLARAADIPARIASVYAPGVTPPDFHAVAEVFLSGGWHLVDATGMASAADIAVIGIGRDIGDVAFLTAFGPLEMNSQTVTVREA
jgi:transglutaminase-like putative cysteine protease